MDLQKTLAQEGPELIPSLPGELIADVKQMKCLAPYRDELIQGAQVRQNLAILRQRMIGQTVRRLDWVRRNGMRVMAQVDPHHFFQMRLQYGRGVWNNREFVDDTLAKNPAMAVQSTNERGRMTVGYRAPASPKISGGRSGARGEPATAFCTGRDESPRFSAHESPAPGLIIPDARRTRP